MGGSNGTTARENATVTFYATGRQDANGTVNSNGAAFFHTNSRYNGSKMGVDSKRWTESFA